MELFDRIQRQVKQRNTTFFSNIQEWFLSVCFSPCSQLSNTGWSSEIQQRCGWGGKLGASEEAGTGSMNFHTGKKKIQQCGRGRGLEASKGDGTGTVNFHKRRKATICGLLKTQSRSIDIVWNIPDSILAPWTMNTLLMKHTNVKHPHHCGRIADNLKPMPLDVKARNLLFLFLVYFHIYKSFCQARNS